MLFILGSLMYIIYSLLTIVIYMYSIHKNYSNNMDDIALSKNKDIETKINKYLKPLGYFSYYLMLFGYLFKKLKK